MEITKDNVVALLDQAIRVDDKIREILSIHIPEANFIMFDRKDDQISVSYSDGYSDFSTINFPISYLHTSLLEIEVFVKMKKVS